MLLFYEFKKLIKNKAVTAPMLILLAVIAVAANAVFRSGLRARNAGEAEEKLTLFEPNIDKTEHQH